MTAAAFWRITGTAVNAFGVGAEEENSPMNRRSPMTLLVRVEHPEADVVQVRRPVDPGLVVVLGDDHQLGSAVGPSAAAHGTCPGRILVTAQDAQARRRHELHLDSQTILGDPCTRGSRGT